MSIDIAADSGNDGPTPFDDENDPSSDIVNDGAPVEYVPAVTTGVRIVAPCVYFTPNPVFGDAYLSGAVEVEHWSFLAFSQRLEAAAKGLPAIVTRSITDRSAARTAIHNSFVGAATPGGAEPGAKNEK